MTHDIPLASHDDTTVDDVTQAAEEGIFIAEFPTTEVAAEKAREKGLTTIMGAPNAIRGILTKDCSGLIKNDQTSSICSRNSGRFRNGKLIHF
jgi:alpha-D-ribose 1-methylphosphonate 5-triphosphate diphosphatase PhnM